MSLQSTVITEEIENYLIGLFSPDDEFMLRLKSEAEESGFPLIHISPLQAGFLQFLVRLTKAGQILEIGTLAGYSGMAMAKAQEESGRLTTLEMDPLRAEFARAKFREAGLDGRTEVICCDAHEYLDSLGDDIYFDFVFVDADKEGYRHYLDIAAERLKIGGIVAFDNCLAFGEIAYPDPERSVEVNAIREFNEYFRNHERFSMTLATIGDGIAIGVKIK